MFIRAAFLALPFIAQVLAKECLRTYVVQDKDICDSISAAKNVSTYQLSAANPSINSACNNLVPGSQLCLGYSGEDCATTYKVVPDDTCEQVAANHKINTTILFSNNPQLESDCGNLYVGEVLCVLDKVQVPPRPSGYLPGATIPVTAAPANPSAHPYTSYTTSYFTTTRAPAATPTKGSDDGDDLPYCDEL